jgi:hypothetical protein
MIFITNKARTGPGSAARFVEKARKGHKRLPKIA